MITEVENNPMNQTIKFDYGLVISLKRNNDTNEDCGERRTPLKALVMNSEVAETHVVVTIFTRQIVDEASGYWGRD